MGLEKGVGGGLRRWDIYRNLKKGGKRKKKREVTGRGGGGGGRRAKESELECT